MIVRLGYVAIALSLPKVTTSSTVTYKNYSKLVSEEEKLNKLKKVTLSNLNALKTILKFNCDNEIHFYRLTSTLIPLVTHPEVEWDYLKLFKKDLEEIGELIKLYKIRVDAHPSEFNVINSEKESVVKATEINLLHQAEIFEAMNYNLGKLVIHVGSSAGGKESALNRFKKNFALYPETIKKRLMIENDDKTFTAKEVLYLCNDINIPMVLDVHHYNCNNDGEDLKEITYNAFKTWENQIFPPKIHFSSPKDGENDRKHSDYINAEDFINYLQMTKEININYDVMIEAKKKDLALFKLREDIKKYKPEWKWIDNSTLEV